MNFDRIGNNPVLYQCCHGHQTHNQLLLTSLRESIINKPSYISGTLQLPDSFFSLFYKVTRDGNAARFEDDEPKFRSKGRLLTFLVFRHINFAHATPNELEQLTQACEVSNEDHCKTENIDSEFFSSSMDPYHTDLIKIIRGYLLEGEQSTKGIKIGRPKLNISGAYRS